MTNIILIRGYAIRQVRWWLYLERPIKSSHCTPTSNNIVEIFEKTLRGSFSSGNTRLAFATEMLMLNNTSSDYNKLNIDESFKYF